MFFSFGGGCSPPKGSDDSPLNRGTPCILHKQGVINMGSTFTTELRCPFHSQPLTPPSRRASGPSRRGPRKPRRRAGVRVRRRREHALRRREARAGWVGAQETWLAYRFLGLGCLFSMSLEENQSKYLFGVPRCVVVFCLLCLAFVGEAGLGFSRLCM